MTAILAVFNKATTTVDGGWRLSFDSPETMAELIAEISKLRNQSLYLVVMTEEEYRQRNG